MIKHSSAEVTYDKASSLHIGPKGCASCPSADQSCSSGLTLSYKPRLLAVTSNVAKQVKMATSLRIENTDMRDAAKDASKRLFLKRQAALRMVS